MDGAGEAVLDATGVAFVDTAPCIIGELSVGGAVGKVADSMDEGVRDAALDKTVVCFAVGSLDIGSAEFSSAGSSSMGSGFSCIGDGSTFRFVSPISDRSMKDLTSKDPRNRLSSGFGDWSMLLVKDLVSSKFSSITEDTDGAIDALANAGDAGSLLLTYPGSGVNYCICSDSTINSLPSSVVFRSKGVTISCGSTGTSGCTLVLANLLVNSIGEFGNRGFCKVLCERSRSKV